MIAGKDCVCLLESFTCMSDTLFCHHGEMGSLLVAAMVHLWQTVIEWLYCGDYVCIMWCTQSSLGWVQMKLWTLNFEHFNFNVEVSRWTTYLWMSNGYLEVWLNLQVGILFTSMLRAWLVLS